MHLDRRLVHAIHSRTARDQGAEALVHAWTGTPAGARAAMIAAQGDLLRAAACGGGGWAALAGGNVSQAIDTARASIRAPGMGMLEAEALFAAGAFVAGFTRLEALHEQGDAAASVSLARRRHQMGDHAGAVDAAKVLPLHAHAALIGARAALAADRAAQAWRLVEPLLEGVVVAPEPATAGAAAITGCAVLARWGDQVRLRRFVDALLSIGDLPEDMMPAIARAAWIGGRAHTAWERLGIGDTPWNHAAQLELAVLAGNPELASQSAGEGGSIRCARRAGASAPDGSRPGTRRDDRRDDRCVRGWTHHPCLANAPAPLGAMDRRRASHLGRRRPVRSRPGAVAGSGPASRRGVRRWRLAGGGRCGAGEGAAAAGSGDMDRAEAVRRRGDRARLARRGDRRDPPGAGGGEQSQAGGGSGRFR